MKKFGVRFTVIKKNGSLATKEKGFDSEEKLEKFVEKLVESGNLAEILGYWNRK